MTPRGPWQVRVILFATRTLFVRTTLTYDELFRMPRRRAGATNGSLSTPRLPFAPAAHTQGQRIFTFFDDLAHEKKVV